MIESKEGIEKLEQISQFDIDYFLIGMYDLSASFGHVGDFQNKCFTDGIEKYKHFISKDKAAIHLVRNIEDISKYENDFSFFAIGMDTTMLIDSYNDVFNKAFEVKYA